MLAAIKKTLAGLVDKPARARALHQVLAASRSSVQFGEVIAHFHADRIRAIRQHLEAGIKAGEILGAIDTDLVARTIWATLRGTALLATGDPGSWDLARLADSYVAELRRGLSAGPAVVAPTT